MNLLSYFYPQVIEEVDSPINKRIKVVKLFGKLSLSVGGLTQSGGLVRNIWGEELRKVKHQKLIIKSCLVLGVGGGTAIGLLNKYFPNAKITAIEIDPIMINLARKYFHLDGYKNTEIIVTDAINWVDSFDRRSHKYDLVLADLYIGKDVPFKLNDLQFLKSIKELLTPQGNVIFNRLRNRDNKKEIDVFLKKLGNIFSKVTVSKPLVNYLICCR